MAWNLVRILLEHTSSPSTSPTPTSAALPQPNLPPTPAPPPTPDAIINGTEGNDTLTGTTGNDTINAFGGNDLLRGNEGADLLKGGDGNDTLDAWAGGHFGDGAADTLDGGLGDDVYLVDGDGDVILPDPGGIDTVQARNSSWTLGAGLENLDLVDSLGMATSGTGNDLNNIIRSATEGGTLLGLGGDDLLIARHVANTATLRGGDGNDTLYAIEDDAYLFGDAGDDLLVSAGLETAVMEGGAGADTFRFASVSALAMISDFVSGTDKLSFDGRAFTAIGASGNFSAGDPRFFAGTAAHDADDRVIFDAATGKLYYDADGSGNGIAQLVATVQASAAAATVAATDIVVVDSGTPFRTPTSSPLNGVAVLADDEASHAAQSYPEAPPDLWFHW